MSGIAGVFARDGRPVEAHELEPLLDRLAHRGPDGSARWVEGAVALGHQTLWNTPEAVHETLPLVQQEGPFAITADARIDNRDELIAALGMGDRPAREIGDAALILRAYQRWGAACPEHLVGDFAFGVWDGPQQQVFCARDHLGAKPLVYHLTDALFVCASEAGAITAHPAVPHRINEGRIADYLVTSLQAGDGRRTFFEEVVKLPAAHRLIVGRDAHRLERYWMPDPEREVRLGSDGAYEEAFLELLADAVACRRRSHRGVGVALSGGIDSASIVAVAWTPRGGGEPIPTFSAIDPNDATCPDTRSIRAIVETGGVQAHLLTTDHFSQIWEGLPARIADADAPFDALTSGIGPTLTTFARREGMGALLDGLDGDALMGTGEILVADLLRRGQWAAALHEARALSGAYGMSAARIFWQYGVRASVGLVFPGPVERARARYKHGRAFDAALAERLIAPDFAQRIGLRERLDAARRHWTVVPMTSLRARQANWLMHPNLSDALEQGDRIASRYHLEARSPLMDKRLLEFALALPPTQKMRNGQRKWLLRRAVADLLPSEVIERSSLLERNLGPVFWKRLLKHEAGFLRDFIADPGPVEPYIDTAKAQEAYCNHEQNGFDASNIIAVVEAAVLSGWIKQHHAVV